MKKSLLPLIFILFALACSNRSNYHSVTKFDPDRDPAADLQMAINEARDSGRNIILDVGGEWCIWCHRIDEFIEQNGELKNYLDKHFVVLKINFSKENKNEKFLSAYPKIEGYPHFFVLDKDGNLLHSQNTGELEKDKSYDAGKFMEFLKKWS